MADRTRDRCAEYRRRPGEIIDGVHRGKAVHVGLHLEPDGVLLTRGFHWVNELPFNH